MCASLLCALLPNPAGARGGNRHAALVIDANTGAVLHQDDADVPRHPASLTKIMTLFMTFETLESGRLKLTDRVVISEKAASVAPSKLDLDPGQDILVSDAIRALITKSANDVAVALAEKIGGSQENFVKLMNQRAREIGMTKTHFENASGLPDPDQVTTARDMVTLALHLQDNYPGYYQLFATRAFSFRGKTYRNHNTMLNSFAGIDGIKTGYTRASGFNLVSSARRNGRHLVAAVFGGDTAGERNNEMRVLLTKAFNRASPVKSRKPMPAMIAKLKQAPKPAARPVKDGAKTELAALAAPSAPVPAPVAAARPFAPAAKPAPVAAPIAAASPAAKPAASLAPVQNKPIASAAAPVAAPALAPVATEVAENAQPAAPLEVFKVKRVPVGPRHGPPAPGPDETTDEPTPDALAALAAETAAVDAAQVADVGTATVPDAKRPALPGATPRTADPADRLAATMASDSGQIAGETVIAKAEGSNQPVARDTRMTMLGAADVAAESATNAPVATAPPQPAAIAAARPAVPAAKPAPASASASAAAVKPAPVKAVAAPRPAQPAPMATTVAAAPAAPVQRGLPPSSLQAQAQAMALGARPTAAPYQRMAALQPANAAAPAAAGAPHGRYEIQIGAYGSIGEAQRALGSAQTRAGKLLAGHASVTQPTQRDGRQMFRARFTGFDASGASATCTELRRQSVDCFVMSAE